MAISKEKFATTLEDVAEQSGDAAKGGVPSVGGLFPEANPRAPGLTALLTQALTLASLKEQARELVVDIKALIRASVVSGWDAPAQQLSSARWLTEALERADNSFASQLQLQARSWLRAAEEKLALEQPASLADYTYVRSHSLNGRIIPRALELARLTVGRKRFDQRHLLMALLEQSPQKWQSALGIPITAQQLARISAEVVAQIGKSPETKERMDAWTAILGQSEEIHEEQRYNDFLAAQRDDPAKTDQLGRKPFAEVLAQRMLEVRPSQIRNPHVTGVDRGFMINLDGPWGSGKSSIVNFIKDDLSHQPDPWLSVDLNAWRSQRIEPAWWAIICQLAEQVPPQLDQWRGLKFRAIWWGWKLRNDFAPIALALILLGIAAIALLAAPLAASINPEAGWLQKIVPSVSGWGLVTGAIGFLTTIAGLATLGRTIFFGSAHTGQAMAALNEDPYVPAMRLFNRLVWAARRPILVVIDDIDRCSEEYVVDLLEDIQTMLRGTDYLSRRWGPVLDYIELLPSLRALQGQPGLPRKAAGTPIS